MSSMSRQGEPIADYNPRYWRTLDELANTPEFREWIAKEFPHGVDLERLSRRRWLQLMAASFTLAGFAGCRWEKTEIVPFVHRPTGRIPGKPERFATAIDLSGEVTGLVATCVDGRPIKLEGNPVHPSSLGGTDAFAQAAVLQLYDPDRSRDVIARSDGQWVVRSWEDFTAALRERVAATSSGEGWVFVTGATSSPTVRRLRKLLEQRWPKAQWFTYEPLHDDFVRRGTREAFGVEARPVYRLNQAKVILALDADLFFESTGHVRAARDFAATRDGNPDRMSRLYAVETRWTLSGSSADHRLPLSPGEISAFVDALENCLATLAAGESLPDIGSSPDQSPEARYRAVFLKAVAEDLWQYRGRSVVAAGNWLGPEVHAAVARINKRLESLGGPVVYLPVSDPMTARTAESLHALHELLVSGSVQNILFADTNPVYSAPLAMKLNQLIERVPFSAHLGLYADETALSCRWHIPMAHFLEAWGDAETWDGTYTVVQPMIAPLWGGKSVIELLSLFLDANKNAQDWVYETFQARYPHSQAADWERCLAQGLFREENRQLNSLTELANTAKREIPGDAVERFVAGEKSTGNSVSVLLTADYSVYDGRFANNAWLQEWPDPVTRLTWGNAAVIGVETARGLDCKDGSVIRLEVSSATLDLPVVVVPGIPPRTVVVSLGYGRSAAGHVGGLVRENIPPVGVNTYALRSDASQFVFSGVKVTKLPRNQPLASVQDHHLIDRVGLQGRVERLGELVREVTLERLTDPHEPYSAEEVVHHPPLESLWPEHTYDGHRWGMAVDLSKCIGCGACVVACQAENNIPVVGPAQVMRSREMHWIRIDRYFTGTPENPRTVHQPVMCQQCEMAPCEQVCPVAATVHSHEGLNDMVYNRCIGTRYCANNCPYKVRRFNYFYYHKDLDNPRNEVQKMVYNPEVTIRSRGVMEKCTYCVQRIQNAKIEAKNQRRPLIDGEIQTACQQVCPAQAIVFGDLADPSSAVAQLHQSNRAYGMLAELNVKPRTKYLARVRNPHPALQAIEYREPAATHEHGA
ncbi:TAT-variant-translocated molybdopterin oxidoreductase [Thermogutta sp.]|uniref:TAT-variant-translocated molybdopterin oxidoreductase n=1 Tax=Thermogutta sp. TaxID=1962930 RepID=UPI003C7C8E46